MVLSPGDRVDRYEVIELLGAGGMGQVYRARDPKLARLVALKILRVDAASGADGAVRLLREARAAAALSHANVLSVFDVGKVEEPESLRGLAYIAMELVEGKALRSYVGDNTIPLERRMRWLCDVARALGAAHQAGVVHGDVKPENVMIRSDGAVKVLDFGIARRVMAPIDRLASTGGQSVPLSKGMPTEGLLLTSEPGRVIGTPYYMAPEQLRGEPIDGRADQFSWGVMAYELLTGMAPWQKSAELLATVSEILSLDPRAPIEVEPSVPLRWSNAILRALAKQRGGRFATMEALVASVEEATSESSGSTPPRLTPRDSALTEKLDTAAPAHGRRTLLLRWLLGATALVTVVAAVVALRRGHPRVAASTVASAVAAPVRDECTSNAACVLGRGGEAWRCHPQRHVCVPIASADCKVYADPHAAEAEDVVWLGGMFPLNKDAGFIDEVRATELAREDFAQALGASAGRKGPLHARPIGLVMCDEGRDAVRAAQHLVNDVQVPAVIGFRSQRSALTTIPTVFLPNRVLSVISISQSSSIMKIPEPEGEPRLVWRTTLNSDDEVTPLAHLISDVLEPAARAMPHGIGKQPFKVAVVSTKDTSYAIADSLLGKLRFNGLSAVENGSNFSEFVFDTGDDADAGDVVDALLSFAPHVIFFAGSRDAFFSKVLRPLEARWAVGPPPTYVCESGFPPAVAQFVGSDSSRRHRFFSDTNFSTTLTNARLVLRYNLAFPIEPVVRSVAPQPSYDAFYVLAYATYALGEGTVTGPALSVAIQRLLPPGHKVDVGPEQILGAFQILRAGGNIDLNGAIGSLDFDLATGEAPITYSILCLGVDDRGGASEGIDSGLIYDAHAKRLVGVLQCP